jgi:hypothetical protein
MLWDHLTHCFQLRLMSQSLTICSALATVNVRSPQPRLALHSHIHPDPIPLYSQDIPHVSTCTYPFIGRITVQQRALYQKKSVTMYKLLRASVIIHVRSHPSYVVCP